MANVIGSQQEKQNNGLEDSCACPLLRFIIGMDLNGR
jgi:hypothetical protein